jgi:hypothetical protein
VVVVRVRLVFVCVAHTSGSCVKKRFSGREWFPAGPPQLQSPNQAGESFTPFLVERLPTLLQRLFEDRLVSTKNERSCRRFVIEFLDQLSHQLTFRLASIQTRRTITESGMLDVTQDRATR